MITVANWTTSTFPLRDPGWGLRGFQRSLPLIQKLAALISAVSVLIQHCTLAENLSTALSSPGFKDDIFQFNFEFFFEIFRSTSILRHRILTFRPNGWKEVNSKEVFPAQPSYGPKIWLKLIFLGFFVLLKWENWYDSSFQKHFPV